MKKKEGKMCIPINNDFLKKISYEDREKYLKTVMSELTRILSNRILFFDLNCSLKRN